MKKALLFLGLATLIFSCKKTYQCECKEIHNYETWNPTITNVAIEENKKDDAWTICNSLDVTYSQGNYRDCNLK